jgi:hypothetical protein
VPPLHDRPVVRMGKTLRLFDEAGAGLAWSCGPNHPAHSMASEFFTDDCICCRAGHPNGFAVYDHGDALRQVRNTVLPSASAGIDC